LRSELHPKGLEVVSVGIETSGPDACREFIELAHPQHPSLVDATHQMEAHFGVVNIPNVVWIDENGVIVRPPEPGWPGPTQYPAFLAQRMRAAAEEAEKVELAPEEQRERDEQRATAQRVRSITSGGQDRDAYPDAIRDWVDKGAASQYAMSPDEVVARSQPRPIAGSEGAAHFELGSHLWQAGKQDAAILHFNEAHRLQPDNWTYKRQAWSLFGYEQAAGGDMGRFNQNAHPGREDDWPFDSDF
jgi:tetratricopeptide (TPR) repeat protein